jgi:excinuclease ABC subunit C
MHNYYLLGLRLINLVENSCYNQDRGFNLGGIGVYTTKIEDRLTEIPQKPGVYFFKDKQGKVLYVGKAKNLRNRLRSYFQKVEQRSRKLEIMLVQADKFDVCITKNELEALILECNLIKKYHPPFNVNYRDDKSYPYLAISVKDTYPRVYITREKHRKGVKYYGPYATVYAIRDTYDTLRKIFPFRNCPGKEPGRVSGSPCLNYHIKRCLAPCVGKVTPQVYRGIINQVSSFLEGRIEPIINRLKREMSQASANLEFEKAARIRDRLLAAQKVVERQRIVSERKADFDAIAIVTKDDFIVANLTVVRSGMVVGSGNFVLNEKEAREDYMTSFIKQYYFERPTIPPLILTSEEVTDKELIENWLSKKRGGQVRINRPTWGEGKKVVEIALENASHALSSKLSEEKALKLKQALEELAKLLNLKNKLSRIECFDISTIAGTDSVGSMVVFLTGQPLKDHYRRFRIKRKVGMNDYAMMKEVLIRRFEKYKQGFDNAFSQKPDLILVDGGKAQLSAAIEVLKEAKISDIPVAALAKRQEEIFIPGSKIPIKLSSTSAALKLVQRLRDEAHRFAITYHRRLRQKKLSESELDKIPGIGWRRKKLLIKYFGSVEAIANAKLEDLQAIPGLPDTIAKRVFRYFNKSMRF